MAPNAGVVVAPAAGALIPPKRDGVLCWPKAGALVAPKREVVAPKAGVEPVLKLKGLGTAVLLAPPKLKAMIDGDSQ